LIFLFDCFHFNSIFLSRFFFISFSLGLRLVRNSLFLGGCISNLFGFRVSDSLFLSSLRVCNSLFLGGSYIGDSLSLRLFLGEFLCFLFGYSSLSFFFEFLLVSNFGLSLCNSFKPLFLSEFLSGLSLSNFFLLCNLLLIFFKISKGLGFSICFLLGNSISFNLLSFSVSGFFLFESSLFFLLDAFSFSSLSF